MTWLVSPLVPGGTVLSACSGQFRRLGQTDVITASSGAELSLFSVSGDGKLTLCFKQPVLCHIRGLQTLQYHQQGSIDRLVALLESGNLVVLQHNQQLDRFLVVQERSLTYGAVDADHLCNKLAVSCYGTSLAVAAVKGRIACISSVLKGPWGPDNSAEQTTSSALWHAQHATAASKSSIGRGPGPTRCWQQLPEPVVYAATAPTIAGAVDLSRGLRGRMELGNIVDLAFFSSSSCLRSNGVRGSQASSLQGRPLLEHLAVLSHRHGEDASEVYVFSWDVQTSQLCKLGLATLPHHGTEAVMGLPLHLTAVPSSDTAMVLIGTQALLVLDFTAILRSPVTPSVSATVELQGQHTIIGEGHADLHQRWKATHQTELLCLVGRCVTATMGTADKAHTEHDTGQGDQSVGECMAPQQVSEQQLQQTQQGEEQQEEQVADLGPQDGWEYAADRYEELLATGYYIDMGDDGTPTSSDSDDMDDGVSSSQEDQHAPSSAPAAATAGEQGGPALITAWAWLMSGTHCPTSASVQPLTVGAATDTKIATPDAAVDALVIATASGNLVKLSLLVEVGCSSSPADYGNLEQQPSGIYVSKVQQMLQLPSGPADLLLPLPGQCLLATADSKSLMQVLAPGAEQTVCASAARLTSDAVAAEETHPVVPVHEPAPASVGLQQQQQPVVADDALAATAAATAGTPPYSHSVEAAAGSSLLGSALGRLDELLLESQGQVQQASSHSRPVTAADMDLDMCSGPTAAAGPEQQAAEVGTAEAAVPAQPADVVSSDDTTQCAAVAGAVVAGESAPVQQQQQEVVHAENQQESAPLLADQLGAPTAYRVVQELQLLGPIESSIVTQQLQGFLSQSSAGAGAQTTPDVDLNSADSSVAEIPALVAASRRASGGLRVLRPGTAAQLLQSGPVGMLTGATGMWAIEASPSSPEHSVLVMSFTNASRALSVGSRFTDVSDIIGLQGSEPTVMAACVWDAVMLQVTPSRAKLCCMEEMLCGGNSTTGQRRWPAGAKSSRVSQQQGNIGADSDMSDGYVAEAAADTAANRARSAAADAGMADVPAAAYTAAAAASAGVNTVVDAAHCAETSALVSQQLELENASALPPTAAGRAAVTANDSHRSTAANTSDQWLVASFSQLQQNQMQSRIVQAAAVPGAAVVYLSSGHLVVLEVCSQQQHKKQQQKTSEFSPTNMQSTEQSASDIPCGPPVCRKRLRKHWCLAESGTLKLQQQVSCLQICSADDCISTSTAAVTGSSSSSSSGSKSWAACSHYVFVGCYNGSIHMCAVCTGSSSSSSGSRQLQVIHTFCVEQLHPLRLLLRVTAGPSSRAAAANAVSPAVPHSCMVIQHEDAPCQQIMREAEGSAGPYGASQAAAGRTIHGKSTGGSGSALLVMVSYRNGDVALYQLTNIPKQQQQQQAVRDTFSGPAASYAHQSCIQLKVLSQIRLTGAPVQLQRFNAHGLTAHTPLSIANQSNDSEWVGQQILAAGDRLWVLQLDRNTHQVKLLPLLTPQAALVVSLHLPALPGGQLAHAALKEQHLFSNAARAAVSQQAGLLQTAEAADAVVQHSQQQHIACVSPAGQLQLLAVPVTLESGGLKLQTWLEGLSVSQVQQHRGSELLLAICMGPSRSHLHRSEVTGRQPPHVSMLQCLDPCTGARIAAYQPSGGQTITCMSSWDAAADAFVTGPWPCSDTSSSPEQQQQGFGTPGGGRGSRGGFAAAVGLLFGRQRPPDNTMLGPAHQVVGAPGPISPGSVAGTSGATTHGRAGTSGVSDQPFCYADLLRCCSHLESPSAGAGYKSNPWAAGRTSGHTVHRVGPLVILGTEIADIADQLDGCKGQVIVLRLVKYVGHSQARGLGHAAPSQTSSGGEAGPSAAAAAAAGDNPQAASSYARAGKPAAAAAAAAVGHHGYHVQRVARLRMPEPVTAVCGVGRDLLLVAAGSTVAVYRIQQDKLQQAAHCFARAPVVSLSVAGHGSNLVMSADLFQGVTAYQVEVQQATGEVSISAVAAHMEIRRVMQVACLPPVAVGIRQNRSPSSSSNSSSTEECSKETAALGRAHCLGLDRRGCAFEVSWAKDRVVPAKTLMTVACMPLGGAAAALQVPNNVSASVSDSSSSSSDAWSVKCVYDLTGNEDICAHWQDPLAAAPALSVSGSSGTRPLLAAAGDAASCAIAATKAGTVLQLQKLPAGEGRILQHIEQVILQHPVTRALCIGGEQLLKQQQGSNLAGAGLPPCKPPVKLAAVDARVLRLLLLLPLELQQRVLQEAGLGRVLSGRGLRLLQDPVLQQAFLDSILCRLQLMPCWE